MVGSLLTESKLTSTEPLGPAQAVIRTRSPAATAATTSTAVEPVTVRDQRWSSEPVVRAIETARQVPSPPAERPSVPLISTEGPVKVLGTVHSATVGAWVLPLMRPGWMLPPVTAAQVSAGSVQVPAENDGIGVRM